MLLLQGASPASRAAAVHIAPLSLGGARETEGRRQRNDAGKSQPARTRVIRNNNNNNDDDNNNNNDDNNKNNKDDDDDELQ